jgi:hypothetical protein
VAKAVNHLKEKGGTKKGGQIYFLYSKRPLLADSVEKLPLQFLPTKERCLR